MSVPSDANQVACPECGSVQSRVTDSRGYPTGIFKRRRRACFKCEHRFTTYEISQKTYDELTAAMNGLHAFKRLLAELPQKVTEDRTPESLGETNTPDQQGSTK